MSSKPILGCVSCDQRYSEEDVAAGLYWPQTFTCSKCYARLQQMDITLSCFGKCSEIDAATGERYLGYDPEALECREVCPDRVVCSRVFHHEEED
jgi:hypothetical protein